MSRVLVVDDEPSVCDALAAVLERGGYQVLTAPDGETGLSLCREDSVAVVIVDIVMPEMSGVEVVRKLREEFPEIGIIAISGGGNAAVAGYQPDAIKTAAYVAAAAEAGADNWLTKPFERAELLERVAALTGP